MKLGEMRAVGEGFPLRGSFRIVRSEGGAEAVAASVPARGNGLAGPRRRAVAIGARIGDAVRSAMPRCG